MQIVELPLNVLISIDFDAVDECRPGALYSVLDVNMLQVDLPKALGPKQMVDVLVATSASVRVPIFPIVVCVRSAYVIGAGVGFRVESGAVVLLQLDL